MAEESPRLQSPANLELRIDSPAQPKKMEVVESVQGEIEENLQVPEDLIDEVKELQKGIEEENELRIKAKQSAFNLIGTVLISPGMASAVDIEKIDENLQSGVRKMTDYNTAFLNRKEGDYNCNLENGKFRLSDGTQGKVYLKDTVDMLKAISQAEEGIPEGVVTQAKEQIVILEKIITDKEQFDRFVIGLEGIDAEGKLKLGEISRQIAIGEIDFEDAVRKAMPLVPNELSEALNNPTSDNPNALELVQKLSEAIGGKVPPEEILQALQKLAKGEKSKLKDKLKENSGTLLIMLLYLLMGVSAASNAVTQAAAPPPTGGGGR